MNKIKFKIKTENFGEFLKKLEELTKISPTIKLKIDNDDILIYSVLGKAAVLAFKNYMFKTSDLFEIKSELENTFDIVILEGKKFVKNLEFLQSNQNITFEISYKQNHDDDSVMDARAIQLVGGKLKINLIAGEHYEIRDMNKNSLSKGLDLKNKKWSFTIKKEDYLDIKKLSSINGTKLLNINVVKGIVKITETSAWELEIDEIEDRNANFILNKKFLSCINERDEITFHIFESFMLIKDEDSNLMLSFEQDWSEDDV
jgi:hypothetical protein